MAKCQNLYQKVLLKACGVKMVSDFKIDSKKINIGGLEGFVYWIEFPEQNRTKGKAQFFFKKVNEDYFRKEEYLNLLSCGAKQEEVVAFLDTFYPNYYPWEKDAKYESYMRTGVGSAVLEKIIEDVTAEGIDALCFVTYNESMKQFGFKKGFEIRGKKNEFYFKRLN